MRCYPSSKKLSCHAPPKQGARTCLGYRPNTGGDRGHLPNRCREATAHNPASDGVRETHTARVVGDDVLERIEGRRPQCSESVDPEGDEDAAGGAGSIEEHAARLTLDGLARRRPPALSAARYLEGVGAPPTNRAERVGDSGVEVVGDA